MIKKQILIHKVLITYYMSNTGNPKMNDTLLLLKQSYTTGDTDVKINKFQFRMVL